MKHIYIFSGFIHILDVLDRYPVQAYMPKNINTNNMFFSVCVPKHIAL